MPGYLTFILCAPIRNRSKIDKTIIPSKPHILSASSGLPHADLGTGAGVSLAFAPFLCSDALRSAFPCLADIRDHGLVSYCCENHLVLAWMEIPIFGTSCLSDSPDTRHRAQDMDPNFLVDVIQSKRVQYLGAGEPVHIWTMTRIAGSIAESTC
jgi:hypothetical protein